MMMNDDMALLREYAAHNSEEAFAALVGRHVGLVYSAALRQARDPHLAGEITQTVFIILARKAGSFDSKIILPSWLYRTANYVAGAALKIQRRREQREQKACMQAMIQEPQTDSTWEQLSPLLDGAMAQLRESDREILVLRFFQNKNFKDVGAALGMEETTARKRVERALEKLRGLFAKHGVSSTASVIAGAISANSIQTAPVALANSVTAAALAKGAAAGGSTLALLRGALKIMAWTKLKTAIVTGAALLLAGTVTTIAVKAISHYREKSREDAIWSHITAIAWPQLRDEPPIVSIRPTKFSGNPEGGWVGDGNKQLAFSKTVETMLHDAYGIGPGHIVAETPLPPGRYDFIVSLPSHGSEALQAAIKAQFGLVAKKEMRDTSVLLLKVAMPDAPGLRHATANSAVLNSWSTGRIKLGKLPIATLAFNLERYLKTPVINQTDLAGRYDIDLKWNEDRLNPDPEAMKQAMLDTLGLELAPDTQPIEMLVVTKAK